MSIINQGVCPSLLLVMNSARAQSVFIVKPTTVNFLWAVADTQKAGLEDVKMDLLDALQFPWNYHAGMLHFTLGLDVSFKNSEEKVMEDLTRIPGMAWFMMLQEFVHGVNHAKPWSIAVVIMWICCL